MTTIIITVKLHAILLQYGPWQEQMKIKRRGPKIEPCGTPGEKQVHENTQSPKLVLIVPCAKVQTRLGY